ncbi:hypothetical protein HBB04_03601 [Pseudomonas coronafaciens]|nr:SEC-C metal-binding domain-containing protein [Pseudomonas coronafaciens]QIQ73199.1 hypothetical protein HBB04_03601 [Pseudomonas coronafaciens]
MEGIKSGGVTATERLLTDFCRKSFLSAWTFPNPYKDDKHELCDQLVVFGEHIFIFFDRNNIIPFTSTKDPQVLWDRWKRNVIDKQINTANGAERYLHSGRKIYTDTKCTIELPIDIDIKKAHIHKIIVAHGAKEACLNASANNIYGSLGIIYEQLEEPLNIPFMVELDNRAPVHVFDSHNLPILLGELDTVTDFGNYLLEKEQAIKRSIGITYCGEEDLLAHYFLNLDPKTNKHFIGSQDEGFNGFGLEEGLWKDFYGSPTYKKTKEASKVSYMWDELIQRTCDNYENGTLGGNTDLLRGRSAIHEMVKEPRFMRRSIIELMQQAIETFPEGLTESFRKMTVIPSYFEETVYLFLQLKPPADLHIKSDYRDIRRHILEVACGALKNNSPQYKSIVGIGIDAPKYHSGFGEDFILMPGEQWTPELRAHYEELNQHLDFFKSPNLKKHEKTLYEFLPGDDVGGNEANPKVGRNHPCPCGSGIKFKRCCGA